MIRGMRLTTPLISFVMPVHNSSRYLHESIESVLRQSYQNLELIAVDDGSDDNSLEILHQFAAGDHRVTVVACRHRGISATRNEAWQTARGDFIANLDSDDVAFPVRAELQCQYLLDHTDCVAVGANAFQIDTDGDPLGPLIVRISHDDIVGELLAGRGSALIHSATMFRRGPLEHVGGYREDLPVAEDLDLFLKLSEHGRLANLPETLIRFRRHLDSITAISKSGMQNQTFRKSVVADAFRRRGLPPDSMNVMVFSPPRSTAERYWQWLRYASRSGYRRTARKYAWKLLRGNWYRVDVWVRLLRIQFRSLFQHVYQRVRRMRR